MIHLALSATLLVAAPALAQDRALPSAFTPTAEQDAVYRALSARHESLSCDQLDAMSSDPLGTYLFLIEHAEQPAWVGMRAARCVMVNHAEAAQPTLEQWVTSPETRGLAILAMGQLDAMPLPVAQAVATRALTHGPDPEGMRKRIARATTPEIAALSELPVVGPAPGVE